MVGQFDVDEEADRTASTSSTPTRADDGLRHDIQALTSAQIDVFIALARMLLPASASIAPVAFGGQVRYGMDLRTDDPALLGTQAVEQGNHLIHPFFVNIGAHKSFHRFSEVSSESNGITHVCRDGLALAQLVDDGLGDACASGNLCGTHARRVHVLDKGLTKRLWQICVVHTVACPLQNVALDLSYTCSKHK